MSSIFKFDTVWDAWVITGQILVLDEQELKRRADALRVLAEQGKWNNSNKFTHQTSGTNTNKRNSRPAWDPGNKTISRASVKRTNHQSRNNWGN